jgi:hypothetical protein
MNQQHKLQNPVDEGWSIHIYDRRRRLLCSLEPSHGWIFLLGCLVGLGLAITWGNLARSSPSLSPEGKTVETPPLQLD